MRSCSNNGLLTLGEDFVARKSIRFLVVSSNTVGITESFVRSVVSGISVSAHVACISLRELTSQTGFLILDFPRGDLIIVIESGLINEALVKHSFEEELEISHETGMVTKLVLAEYRDQTIVLLVSHSVNLGKCRETVKEFNAREYGQTIEESEVTSLKQNGEKVNNQSVGNKRGQALVTRKMSIQVQLLTPE